MELKASVMILRRKQMKITKIEILIMITIILVIFFKLALPIILLQIYGDMPYYEVPTWVVWFLSGGARS